MRLRKVIDLAEGWSRRLFSVTADEPRPWHSIIVWWELRRIAYNLIVGFSGILSVLLVFLFVVLPPRDARPEAGVEPLSVIVFAVLANFGYTFGWIAELLARLVSPKEAAGIGPKLLRIGLAFSLFLVALPALAYAIMWVLRVFGQNPVG